MIAGVILAAGGSTRMGSPKAFLSWRGSTFLETIVDRLREAGAADVYVVVRADDVERACGLVGPKGAKVLINTDPEDQGPISSIRVALDAILESSRGILVCLVDHPGVERVTYATLLQEARDNPGRIIIPVCQGRRGHPTLFPAEVFDDLRQVPSGHGADYVVERQGHRVVEIKVADAGILRNIDTPEEYRNAIDLESQ